MSGYGELLGPAGPLAVAVPAFESRREQQEMADWVGEALEERAVLAVEAGTGTGKTFAYLVPALLSGRHVIVSTGTRTLQDQLYHRDLPMLAKALGRPVKVALLKGRANYLCLHRLQLAEQALSLPGFEAPSVKAMKRVREWSRITRKGDMAELTGLRDDDPVRPAVTSTRENCLGLECPEYSRCHVVAARREAQGADVVVVNHHLLLADLSMKEEGFGELLPGTDAVILDEAHQVPDIAAQFFGLSVGSRQAVALVRDTLQELVRSGHVTPGLRDLLSRVEEPIAQALASIRGSRERLDWAELPDAFIESLHAAVAAIEALRQALKDTGSDDAGLKACIRRCDSLLEGLGEMLALRPEDGVRWVDTAARSFTLGFSPFEVADRLKELMTSRPCAWVFTSATLAIGDDFGHFLDRIGATGARTLRVPSPFDFERQALLYLPQGLPEPSDRSHTAAVLAAALPLIEAADGRAFLLFTSHRALKEAARVLRLRDGFEDRFPMLVQGEAPRESLLARFRAEPHSVLLGTSSFWEGVDVRGTSLVLVVIDKLPFASPDDPLLKARLEGIRRRDGNPFFEYQVPQAVLALKQGFGRLIRDREDFGVVAICDPRLRTKAYGRQFIQALPPATLTQDGSEAVRFLQERLADAGVESRRRGVA
jgi:ATP-dependent DNA helicase DinG